MYLLEAIHNAVLDATKNCINKSWYVKPWLYFILILKTAWYYSPYKRALAIIAYFEYKKTFMYQERARLFGGELAKQMYTDNTEFLFFAGKLNWKHHIRAIFIPYNYICNKYLEEN